MIKVLHILDSLNRGGAEMLELDVCRNAERADFDLTFVATGGGDLEHDFATSGADFVRLTRRFPVDPFLVRQLRGLIRDRKIDVVHCHQAVEAIHAWLATRGTGVKCVMSLHAYLTDRKNRVASRLIMLRLDAVCPVSKAMEDWYRQAEGFGGKLIYHVVHNGIDADRLTAADPTDMRLELAMDSNAILLGMVGNFYADGRKDQLTICRALPSVFDAFPSAQMIFVGAVHDGADRYYKQCVDRCRENGSSRRVHFLGKRSDVPGILRSLDAFIFSTVQEGFGIAGVEAMMLGVPTVFSNIPPLMEVMGFETADGLCAEPFRTGDPADLASKLKAMLDKPKLSQDMAERGRIETRKRFGVDAHLDSLGHIYEKIVSSR